MPISLSNYHAYKNLKEVVDMHINRLSLKYLHETTASSKSVTVSLLLCTWPYCIRFNWVIIQVGIVRQFNVLVTNYISPVSDVELGAK